MEMLDILIAKVFTLMRGETLFDLVMNDFVNELAEEIKMITRTVHDSEYRTKWYRYI